MPNSPSTPPGNSLNPQTPSVIFANWREMLNQQKLAWNKRHAYAEAIGRYLDYCRLNGVSVATGSARGFMSDVLRHGLTQQGQSWKDALNWFFQEGGKRAAPRPDGVPTLGRADTRKA